MHLRSFQPVMASITWMLMLFGPASGCVSDSTVDNPTIITSNSTEEIDTASSAQAGISSDRQAELTELAQVWVETRDDSLVQQIQDEQELRFVEDLLQQWQDEVDTGSTNTDPAPPPIAGCSGYWGTYRFATQAEYMSGSRSYSYYWSPNCYMAAPGDDCGTDHNDNMVSFWMGPDWTLTEAAYRVDTISWATYVDLLYHRLTTSGRIYMSNAYGAWYGNAYVCLSNTLDASTLRFGRDY